MSFHGNTGNLIKRAAQREYENACKSFGKTYHSLHEGWAVLKEEVEESSTPVNRIQSLMDKLWQVIKAGDTELSLEFALSIQEWALNGMMELAQVMACCQKFIDTMEVME